MDSTLYPHKIDVIFRTLWRYIPAPIVNYFRYLPRREYTRFRRYLDFIQDFSRGLVAKSEAKGDGKDVMSVLLRANAAETSHLKLSSSEVIDQISSVFFLYLPRTSVYVNLNHPRALLLAGHDTIANTLTWWLWELAKHPDSQSRVMEEIASARAKLEARGETEFSIADLEGMIFMNATMKVGPI